MPDLIGSFWSVVGLLALGVLLLKLFALIDAATRRTDLFEAAGKLKKPFWLIILGIAVVWDLLTVRHPSGLINILTVAGLIAAIVYVVDVRPAVRALGKGGNRGDGRHMGPYGPW
jgi:hypothetical protein